MFGKWIVLEGISSPTKAFITRSILKSYPGCMKHIAIDHKSDLISNLKSNLEIKEKINSLLIENTSVICSSWISSSLSKYNVQLGNSEMVILHDIMKESRPDLSVAILESDTEYERSLAKSGHIDLVLNLKELDEQRISRLILDHLLHHDF